MSLCCNREDSPKASRFLCYVIPLSLICSLFICITWHSKNMPNLYFKTRLIWSYSSYLKYFCLTPSSFPTREHHIYYYIVILFFLRLPRQCIFPAGIIVHVPYLCKLCMWGSSLVLWELLKDKASWFITFMPYNLVQGYWIYVYNGDWVRVLGS